jgi:hypothetical protein
MEDHIGRNVCVYGRHHRHRVDGWKEGTVVAPHQIPSLFSLSSSLPFFPPTERTETDLVKGSAAVVEWRSKRH